MRSRFILSTLILCALAAAPAAAQYSSAVGGGGVGWGGGGGGFGGGGFGGGGWGGAASGQAGFGRPNNLSLVVAQTQEGHEGVSDLLGQLRRMQDQQVMNEVRYNNLNDSFYENIGVNFGFNIRGGGNVRGIDQAGNLTPDIQFRQGGNTPPQFGGYDPSADNTTGFAVRGGPGDMFFNITASQGSNRSMVTQAPSVVIPNGGQGYFSDTSQTPFVTSIIPVVGAGLPHYPSMGGGGISPVRQRLQQMNYEDLQRLTKRSSSTQAAQQPAPQVGGGGGPIGPSSADRGDLSIAEIRSQQVAGGSQEDRELGAILERARGAEEAGKLNVAKIYYRQAAARATGAKKDELVKKLREIESGN